MAILLKSKKGEISLKKIATLVLAAAVLLTGNLSTVSAASMETYGKTKMNLWDLYLTENNADRPDAISTATVDAVSQATYNPYDNKPVTIETGITSGLIADSLIMESYGIKNEMVDRILKTWREGYSIRLLGTSETETNPLTRETVRYIADDNTTYDLNYEDVTSALSDSKNKNFDWETFAKLMSRKSQVIPPYQVKYLLDSGGFGKRMLVSSKTGLTPPVLALDEEFGSNPNNVGKFVKFNFENNGAWADAVYAIKVNESGLLQGNMDLGSYSDHNGDTSFIKGQDKADKSQILIRLSQKFRLGENKLTFMAYGYKDIDFTLNLDQDQSTYPWIVAFHAVNADNNDEPLTESSVVRSGDRIKVEGKGTNFSGKFDNLYIDGKPLPKEDTNQQSHQIYYEYSAGGKTLFVNTSNLTGGLHELHLSKHGYNDLRYFFTVKTDELLAPPQLVVQGEEIKVGDSTATGGSIKGTPIILKSDDENLKNWCDHIRQIYYINDNTGKVNEIDKDANSTAYDETAKSVSISAGSMSYWNSSGNYTLVIRSTGFREVKIPVKRVNSMPEGSQISYRTADGAVVLSSSYSFMGSDNLQTVVINGMSYPASNFETVVSYSGSSTLTIPSEYFEPSSLAKVIIKTKNYSELPGQISIPDNHVKRLPTPSVKAEQGKVLRGSSLELRFIDDPSWRGAIQKVVLRSSSNYDNDYKSKTNVDDSGKLMIGPISLSKGSYTLIITAAGYQELKVPVEIVDPLPGAVTYELQPEGSIRVSVAGGSSYVDGISVSLDGQILSGTKLVKSGSTVTLSQDCFPEKKKYKLGLQSLGYADYFLEINTDVMEPPMLMINGQLDTNSKSVTISFSENMPWREAITGAELVSSTGNVTMVSVTDGSTPGRLNLALSGFLSQGDYTVKVSADGYRKAIAKVKILKPLPEGIAYDLLSVDGIPQTYIDLKNYSYTGALNQIQIGETLLAKGDGFTIDSSNYLAMIPGVLKGDEISVTLYADNYPDKILTVKSSSDAPVVTLPTEIAKGAEFTLISEDAPWATAVNSITIGNKSFTGSKLIKNGGTVSISAGDMKNYASYGTGQGVKITADGYRTILFKNKTVYDKPSNTFPQTAEWAGRSLSIDLKENNVSASYPVDKVYIDNNLAVKVTKPSSATSYKLVLSEDNFSEDLSGKQIKIRIVSASYYYLPELIIDATVPN